MRCWKVAVEKKDAGRTNKRTEDEWIAYNKQQAEKHERDLAKGVIDLGSSARGPEEHMACGDDSGGNGGDDDDDHGSGGGVGSEQQRPVDVSPGECAMYEWRQHDSNGTR